VIGFIDPPGRYASYQTQSGKNFCSSYSTCRKTTRRCSRQSRTLSPPSRGPVRKIAKQTPPPALARADRAARL
jgi:hypothetical protein